MKVVVLTTESLHHAFFVREIGMRYPLASVLLETAHSHPPFETRHEFEAVRDEYEKEVWFNNKHSRIEDFATTHNYPKINASGCVSFLKALAPDVVLVFGTSKLSEEVIAACPQGILNLHGGNPEEYRGLDSHLWAIYHGDFDNLVTTLHRVNPTLDDGDIVSMARLPIHHGMELYELRRWNTEICVRLAVQALDSFSQYGNVLSRPQNRKGRYYSSFPAALKHLCVQKFHLHSASLPQ